MIPAPNPDLFPPGPYVLVEDPHRHTMRITALRDWKDGKGPVPLQSAIAEWTMARIRNPQGRTTGWRGFKPSDVAFAHHLLALLNRDWEARK